MITMNFQIYNFSTCSNLTVVLLWVFMAFLVYYVKHISREVSFRLLCGSGSLLRKTDSVNVGLSSLVFKIYLFDVICSNAYLLSLVFSVAHYCCLCLVFLTPRYSVTCKQSPHFVIFFVRSTYVRKLKEF